MRKNQPMEEQRIRQQMEKLGNTEFQWESLNIEINGKVFVPVKVLNEVRREALEQLRETLLSQNRREMVKNSMRNEQISVGGRLVDHFLFMSHANRKMLQKHF